MEINKNEAFNCATLCQNQYQDPSILASQHTLIIIWLWWLVSRQINRLEAMMTDKAKHIFHRAIAAAKFSEIISWSLPYTFLVTVIQLFPLLQWSLGSIKYYLLYYAQNYPLISWSVNCIWKRSWADSTTGLCAWTTWLPIGHFRIT